MIQEIKAKVEKKAGCKAEIINKAAFNKQLDQLEPGAYELIIKPSETKLKRLKKLYFAHESLLAKHMGHTKVEIHEMLKRYIGNHISLSTGEKEYLSISKVSDEADMLERLEELHRLAAEHLNYTFPPFNPKDI